MIINISIVTVLNPHILSFGLHHEIAVSFNVFHPCGLIRNLVRGRISAYRMAVILLSVSLDIPHSCLIRWKNWASDANDWVSFKVNRIQHIWKVDYLMVSRLSLGDWALVKWLDKSSSITVLQIRPKFVKIRTNFGYMFPFTDLPLTHARTTRAFRDFNSPERNRLALNTMEKQKIIPKPNKQRMILTGT